jgi:hypothetical protein
MHEEEKTNMTHTRLLKVIALAGTCAAVGTVVGMSSSVAATPHHSQRGVRASQRGGIRGSFAGLGFGPLGRVIHEVTVVPNATGGFDTLTIDSGKLTTIAGDNLTVAEGTRSASYANPTITVPDGSTVFLDGRHSSLGALATTDRVTIVQDSDGTTTVFAQSPPPPRVSPLFGASGASGSTGLHHHLSTGPSGASGSTSSSGPTGPSGPSGRNNRGAGGNQHNS